MSSVLWVVVVGIGSSLLLAPWLLVEEDSSIDENESVLSLYFAWVMGWTGLLVGLHVLDRWLL